MPLSSIFGFPKIIYQTESPISGKIRVVQKGRERKLLVDGVCQSINWDAPGIEDKVWGRMVGDLDPKGPETLDRRVFEGSVLNLGDNTLQEPSIQGSRPLGFGKVLMLGLGAGTVVHLLARRFPGIGIDGVELDPAIIEVGKKFFDLGKVPNLNIICADACDVVCWGESGGEGEELGFRTSGLAKEKSQALKSVPKPGFGELASSKESSSGELAAANANRNHTKYEIPDTKYGLVIIDLYCGGKFPEKFERDDFLIGVRKLLAPQGLAIFNRIFRRGRRNKLDNFIEKIRRVFGRVEEVEVPGPSGFSNLLILAKGGG